MSVINETALAGIRQGSDPYPSTAGTEAAIRDLAGSVDDLIFPNLTDVPQNYTGDNNRALVQNSTGNGLQFSYVQLFSTAGAPVDYTDGTPPATGEAVAEIGSLCTDHTNGKLYINGGTKAQPIWKLVTSAA